ncbi:hypothetical protein ACOMHN_014422 [Nucella lapillus]
MSTLPSTRPPDLPMIPVPVFPHHSATLLPPGGDNLSGKGMVVGAGVARGVQAGGGHPNNAGPLSEPQQLMSATASEGGANKGHRDTSQAGDTASEGAVDPNRLKFWSVEETLELIQLYKKYLPEFHKFGQRKTNVWQRVTEEMVAKGYGNFSWADCSAKFRNLRDSYRRSTSTGARGGQTWQYYAVMKDVMKLEKMILEQQEPATRHIGHKPPTLTCDTGDAQNPSLPHFPAAVNMANPTIPSGAMSNNPTVPNTAMSNPTMPVSAMSNPIMPGGSQEHPSTSHSQDGGGEAEGADMEEPTRKRISSDTSANANFGPAAKKPKDSGDQDGEIVIGRNFNGESVRVKGGRKAGGGGGIGGGLGTLQALGKSLSLPQSQLVVGDDGQIVQTTSTPTGLYINEGGQLCSSSNNSNTAAGTRQAGSMPQWFKMYEKRTRAENGRRLEELKEMHNHSLDLQRETLEVARHKNELMKTLLESLAEFKALLQR